MAVTDCEELSNIISLGLVSGDDDLAQEIARLSAQKRDAAIRAGKLTAEDAADETTGWTAHELELRSSSADIELRAIVQAKILKGEVRVGDAYRELALQIRETGGTLAGGIDLLEKLRKAKPADFEKIAAAWGGVYKDNPAGAIKEMEEAMSEVISANYSIRQYSDFKSKGLASAKKELREGKITQEQFEEKVANLHKEAMEAIAKGENPEKFAKLDEEWKTIKEIFGDKNPVDAGKSWSQFIMARELLADGAIDDGVLKAFKELISDAQKVAKNKKEWAKKSKAQASGNLVGKLTKGEIAKYKKGDLDKLLARAYTNTEDLYMDGELRRVFREKLVELAAGERVSKENIQKVNSIMKTMQFAQEGMTFSDIAIADNAARSARQRGYKITDGTALLRDLKKLSKALDEGDEVLDKPIKLAGVEMEPQDVIQIIYDITGDKNILKLVKVGFVNDGTVLSIAAQSLLGDVVGAETKIIKLLTKAKEAAKINNVRDISIKAITGGEVKEGAPLGFFDFRKSLYKKDKLTKKKADFMDKLAEKNKMNIDSTDIKEIDGDIDDVDKLATELEKLKGGYLLVNDTKWRDNETLAKALDKVNDGLKEDEQITVLFPRGSMSSNFSMEKGQLVYKTIEDDMFDDVAGTISIQSLGESRPTRELVASAYEAKTGRNGDKLRYQASYTKGAVDNEGRQVSDQQYEYFKNSVLRDKDGNLLVMRHGTNAEFDAFDYGYVRLGNEGIGFYTSADIYKPGGYGKRVIETYVNITNPLDIDHTAGKVAYDVFYSIADDALAEGRITKEAYNSLVDYVSQYAKRGSGKTIDSSFVGFLGEFTHKLKWGHPNLKGRERSEGLNFMANRQGYSRFLTKFNEKTGFDGFINYDGAGNPYTAVAFFQNQIKYVDNKTPTIDSGMKFMRTVADTDRIDTITKLRNSLVRKITYQGRDANSRLTRGNNHGIYRLLENIEKFGKGKKGDYAEAIEATLKYYEDTWANLSIKEPLEEIKKLLKSIDVKEISITDPIKDPKEIARSIFEYSIWSLDKSEIGKMISKNGRINKKLFSKLTRDEQIEVANRVLTYGHLYDMESLINSLDPKGVVFPNAGSSSALDGAGRRLIKNFYLNPYVTTKITDDINLGDFIRKYTDDGLLMHEAGIVADADGKVLGVTVGTGINNYTTELYKTASGKTGTKYYHNHPSGGMPSDADMVLNYPIGMDSLGRILPSGVTVEFGDIKGLKKVWNKYRNRNRLINKMKGHSRLEEGVAFFYEASRELGIIDKQSWGAYDDIIKAQNGAPITQDFLDKISDKALEEARKIEKTLVDLLTPEGETEMRWMKQLDYYAQQADVKAQDAMKVEMFTKDRTWKQIADQYGFDVKIVEGNMIEGVEAWGAYGNGVIYFTEMVKEGTAPHELFHAIFDIVGKEQHDKIIADAVKLFGYNADTAEEVLADAFSEWFRTGKFTYGEMTEKGQKSFFKRVEEFFKDIAEWLGLVDNHKAEVEQMFNDMVNMKYLPDAGKQVDALEAMVKYNKELDKVAADYFGELLGESGKKVDAKYISRVQELLSDRLGIDLKSFDEYADKSQLWKKINEQFSLERLTTGRYDKTIIDINKEKNLIKGLSPAELEKMIKEDIGDLVKNSNIKGSADLEHIREAYLDYRLATSAIDSLTAKGKIISLANGGTAKTMSMSDLKSMFMNGGFEKKYKEMFFPKQNVSEEDMKRFIMEINDNIFDTLSITFAENLTRAGYALPLMNVKTFVRDYLLGKVDINNPFAQAFLFKNHLPYSSDTLRSVADTLMPTSFKFDYEDALYKGRFDDLEKGKASVFREVDNKFLPDSYSAIVAAEMANGLDVGLNYEKDILEGILDKYVTEVYNGVKDGTLTFQKAQELKQQAGYALDVFEQDYLLPRYGRFLSQPERQGLLGMKYSLPIGVAGQNAEDVHKQLIAARNRISQRYSQTLGSAAENNQINAAILTGAKSADELLQKKIEARRQQLIDNGGVIKEVNGQYIVYNVKEALEYTIKNLPSSIGGVDGLRVLGRAGIEQMTNKQAYALLRYLEAAKALDTTANLATELMYKQNPILLQYNFFSAFKVDDGLPRILHANSLLGDDLLKKLDNTTEIDKAAKKNIFAGIISKFNKQGYITSEELDEIIKKSVAETQSNFKQIQMSPKEIKKATKKMELIYKKAFTPYMYLRDIPSGGLLMDGKTTVRNIKQKVKDTIKQQYNQAMDDLKAAGIDDADNIQSSLFITTADGSKISLQDASKMSVDGWKKDIFNNEEMFVAAADEIKQFAVPEGGGEALEKATKEQKEWRNKIIAGYDSTLQAMLNQTEVISQAETKLTTAFMNDARTTMRQYTLTNIIVDALDSVSGLNEEAARGIKDYLIGWKGNISFGKWKPGQIKKRLEKVKESYAKYYSMSLGDLTKATAESKADDLALRLARYFKNLERLLGSADGLTGCTTSQQLNRAFYRIGEVVMNVDSVKGVFGLLSAVEQNQILKFFKFARGDLAQDAAVFIRRGKGNFQESLGGYRDYAEEISGIDRDEFNKIFAANFGEGDFKRILQGLTGFTLTGSWGRTGMKILNVLNGSNFIMRALMSYPGQLLTIPQQGFAYFLKQIGFQKELGVESLSEVDAIRTHFGILDGAYNELFARGKSTVSPDDLRPGAYYNRYGIPDTTEFYSGSNIDAADDYINMYSKIDNYSSSSISATNKWIRQLDPYKDNANNIIDGMFARNFKNIAFLKAIKGNDFMQFSSAADFINFMNNPAVSSTIKTKLMDRVAAYSGRNFRNILGLGFGGIDRAIAGSGFGNIMYGLMQLFNFRGSWGQNIFKQVGSGLTNTFKILFTSNGVWSREGREALAKYVVTQPEFMNFITAVFNDIKWTWKLQRFQDNGRWPEEDMYGAMDFIEFFTETLNMSSQYFQGLQSFGPIRPVFEAASSAFNSHMNPTIYKDTYGVGAFFNALGKNFGRQWKPYNWMAKALAAWTTDGRDGFEAYVQNKFWELSFGSVRYMVNEDQNAYGYTYEMTGQTGGIPSILMGESKFSSDKNFSYEIDNTETWETLKEIFDSDLSWDDRWTYVGNMAKTAINGSQLLSLPKNVWKAVTRDAPSYYTANDLAEYMQKTEAGREFYRRGVVTPQTPEEAEMFFDTILKNGQYRPGSSNFTKSLIQFDDYGHMNGKETGNKNDAEMELWLEHMKYVTNEHGEFKISGGERVEDESWKRLIKDVQLHGQNETYTTALIYNYAKNWLNKHSSDPNYQLYIKMLGQGQAHGLVEYRIGQLLDALNAGQKGKDNKWTKTELGNVGIDRALLLKLGQAPLEGDTMSFFDKLQVLDEDNATVAALQIIQSQAKGEDRKVLDRFFDVKENDDGTKSVSLKYQYESTLKQLGAVAKAIDEGNVDLAVAEASTLVNMYKNKDPSGAVTATLIDSVYNRIYDTDSFSPSQKQAAMIALFHKNKDFIQRNPEKLRELLGDDYDVYAKYMNEMLYQWDGKTISNLESMQSSGTSSSSKGGAASKFSSALKDLASKIGGEGSNAGTSSIGAQKEWVPFTIKGSNLVKELGVNGYTPTVTSLKIDAYKPHADFSPRKDVNRNVKTTTTQQISKKKQLSKIESDTTKALEAES